ncbi:hypothetical protein QQF64_014811 [Cirrhinus molitorella]|uniref:Ig-like domain-containing protein n=1 Tax=Cirrhinus molitorella TaxID=172907 RepID=A0ABR3NT74_9TELE
MCFLKFILLLLIPSHTSGGCYPEIMTGGTQFCSGQSFTITCQLDCNKPSNHLKLVKEGQTESSNNNLNIYVHSANKNHSGTYSCQIENGPKSRVHVSVKDCGFTSTHTSENVHTVNTTSSSLTNTTYQGSTPSRLLEPVLIWYLLFKTGFFLIGSITAALITVCQKR